MYLLFFPILRLKAYEVFPHFILAANLKRPWEVVNLLKLPHSLEARRLHMFTPSPAPLQGFYRCIKWKVKKCASYIGKLTNTKLYQCNSTARTMNIRETYYNIYPRCCQQHCPTKSLKINIFQKLVKITRGS